MPAFTELRKIGEHREAVYSVAFSNDGKRLVTVSRDVTSRVWDVDSGAEVSRIKLDNPGVAEACFSPSGDRVATCTWMMVEENDRRTVKGVVWIWNAADGEVIAKKHVGVKPLDSMQWSNDGSKIVVGSWDGLVHVLDDQANELRTLTVPDEGIYTAVIAVAISADGKYVAAGSKDRTARVWRLEDGTLQATMAGHSGYVNSVKFTSDGERLITGSVDTTNRIWDVNSGKSLQVLHGHTGSVGVVDVSDDDCQLLSVGRDQRLRVWNLQRTYGGQLAVRVEPAGTYSTLFSPDGGRLFVACYDGHVRVLDTTAGIITHDWIAHDSSCNTLSLSQDGSRLLTCSWDKTAKLWNTADRSLLKTFDCEAGVAHCAISPDGKTAALCVQKGLQVWDVDSGMRIGTCAGQAQSLIDVVFSPDGKTIATSAQAGPACIWNATACALVATLGDHNNQATTVMFSHDGKWIATGETGTVRVWNTGHYDLHSTTHLGDSAVHRLTFSPDDSRLAVGAEFVHIVDPDQGRSLLQFQPNDDTIYYLSFNADGSRLATCTTGGSIAINETKSLRQRSSLNLQEKK